MSDTLETQSTTLVSLHPSGSSRPRPRRSQHFIVLLAVSASFALLTASASPPHPDPPGPLQLLLPQTVVLVRTRLAGSSHTNSAGPRCRSSNLLHSPLRCRARSLCQRLNHQITSSDLRITVISLMHIFDPSVCSHIGSSGTPLSSDPRFLDG